MRVATALLFFLTTIVLGAEIKPQKTIRLDSAATDMVLRDANLYLSTAKGDALELSQNSKPKKICSLPHITTPAGERRTQKALTVDAATHSKIVAIGGEDGNLYICKNSQVNKSAFHTDSVIKKLLFLSDTKVLIGLVSSQVVLFDITANKVAYSLQVSSSPLSDMAASEDKKTVAIVGEAGNLYLFDVASGKIKKIYKNVNLDNIYKVDYKKGMLLTAGQDRKATLMSDYGTIKARFDGEFLIYAAGLSPLAQKAAIATTERNDIAVYDTNTKSLLAIAKGHNATLNRIVFLSETSFASCADEDKILIWGIK